MHKHIAPSGSAAIDTVNLQAALDDLAFPLSGLSWETGVITLDGVYQITTALRNGQPGRKTVAIDGRGSTIIYRGPLTDQPMLTVGLPAEPATSRLSPVPLLANLVLVPNKLARGVRISMQTHRSLLENVWIYAARQIGLDVIDSWGSTARNISVMDTHGISVRWYRSGGCTLDSVQVHAYADDWPSPDDMTVVGYDGKPVRTSEPARGAVVIAGQRIAIRNLLAQSLTTFASHPIIHAGTGFTLSQAWFEGNSCGNAYIIVAGGWDIAEGRGAIIEKVKLATNTPCRALVELRERTHDVVVSDCVLQGVRDYIVYAASGKHYGTRVMRCGSYANPIDDSRQIGFSTTATVVADSVEQMTKQAPSVP